LKSGVSFAVVGQVPHRLEGLDSLLVTVEVLGLLRKKRLEGFDIPSRATFVPCGDLVVAIVHDAQLDLPLDHLPIGIGSLVSGRDQLLERAAAISVEGVEARSVG
jgi:hypothetical protein